MKKAPLQLILIFFTLLIPATFTLAFQGESPPTKTTVLYDSALGGTPDSQGFDFLAIGLQANQSYIDGLTILDSSAELGDLAGYFNNQDIVFDRTQGYEVQFIVQIQEENHSNGNRAGFSLIVLSDDLLGIELGFWTNEVWAQEGGTDRLFRHAEGAVLDTTSALIQYRLRIEGENYALFANDAQILAGPVRDYTAFSGAIDPYETANLLFLGDNTRRAGVKSAIRYVAVETADSATETPTPSATFTTMPSPTPSATPSPSSTPEPFETATPSPTPTATRLYFWWLPCTAGYPK